MIKEPSDFRTRLTRRRLLGGLSGLTVTLTSPIWTEATSFAQPAKTGAAKRFIGVFSANGTIASQFFPGFSNLYSTRPNTIPGVSKTTSTPLTAASLGRILAPLATYVSQMVVLQGVDMVSTVSDVLGVMSSNKPGGPHMKGPGAMLTGGSLLPGSFQGAGGPAGNADRISVDQYIAGRIGTHDAHMSLEFGARVIGGAPLNCISYSGANQPNVPIYDATQMYTQMFANANLSSSQLTQLLSERKSVLDFLQSDITALETRLSASDKTRLDAHLTNVRTLETQLSSSAASCTPPAKPATLDPNDITNYPTIAGLMSNMMLLAHTCGMTHVSTFMFANADSWQYYPFAGANEEHHGTSHCSDSDAANVENLVLMNIWHAQQIFTMVDYLAKTPEPDGSGTTMLDNSVFLWGNELGVGNTHSYKNIPWMLAGGAGGYFKTGQFLQYPDVPHNNLLVSICNAMGFSDVTTFGIPGVCTGALTELVA
jgi:Protein of unknown function (DUF1552)